MDSTQALDDFQFEESTQFVAGEKKQFGCLEIKGVKHAVFNGENRIGRDIGCSISINSKALSKEHAVIEIIDPDNHLIYDLGSRNKTRLGKMVLQPEVRYQLGDGTKLHLADISAVYRRLPNGPEVDGDSGSETGSESMLNVNNSVDESVIVPETPGPSKLKQKNSITIQESPSSASDVDGSVGCTRDMLKDTKISDETKCKLDMKDESDDSIFEAETQCIDESLKNRKLDAAVEKDNTSFEAETQCEEIQFKVPGDKHEEKQNISHEENEEDIYEADTQCDISTDSVITDDQKKESTTISTESKDKDRSKSDNVEQNDDIYEAATQCFVSDNKTDAGDMDALSSCTEQTEDLTIDENSLSSTEAINVTKTEDADDLNTAIVANEEVKKSVNIASIADSKLPSDSGDKPNLKNNKECENKDPSSKNERLDISQNEDSFDRSMLEGDDDFFDFETTHIQVKKSSDKSQETSVVSAKQQIAQKSLLSKGNELITSPDRSETTSSIEIKEKEPSTAKLNDSLAKNETEMVTVKNAIDSGEETDPDDIFNAPTQAINSAEEKKSSAQDNSSSGNKADIESVSKVKTRDITSNFSNENIKLSKKENFTVPEVPFKVNINSTKSSVGFNIIKDNEDDIFEAPTQLIETSDVINSPETSPVKKDYKNDKDKLAPICTDEKEDNQKLSKNLDEDVDDDIYEAATQVIEILKKDIEPSIKSQENTLADGGKVKESLKSRTSGDVEQEKEDKEGGGGDDISKACTQQAPMSNKSSKSSKLPAEIVKNLHLTKNDSNKGKQTSQSESNGQDDIYEVATQVIQSTTKKVQDSENISESTLQSIKVAVPASSENKEQDNTFKIPIKEASGAKPSDDHYDDDFCDALTQKIDNKPHEIPLVKTFNKEQEETYKGKIHTNINKATKPSKILPEVSNDETDSIDIYAAMTQPVVPEKNIECVGKNISMEDKIDKANTQKISEKINEPLISEAKKEDKSVRMKESSTKISGSVIPSNALSNVEICERSIITTDDSEIPLKADDRSANVQKSILELTEVIKKREDNKADGTNRLKGNGQSSRQDEIADGVGKKPENTREEKQIDKTKVVPKMSKDTESSKNDISSKIISKTESKKQSSLVKNKEEEEDDETDPEELFDGKSNVVKVDNTREFQTIKSSNNKININIEKAVEEEVSVNPSPTLLEASSTPISEKKIGNIDTGKEKAEDVDAGVRKGNDEKVDTTAKHKQDIDNEKSSEDKKMQETLNTHKIQDSKSDSNSNNFITKGITEIASTNNDIELSHEDSDNDIILPSTQAMEEAAKEAEANETPVEDIPSEEDEGSPVISSKRHMQVRRAKVRKRSTDSKDKSVAELFSGRKKRNLPEENSSLNDSVADIGTRSTRRRKLNESTQNDSKAKDGTRARKQSETSKLSVTMQDGTADASTNYKEDDDKSKKSKLVIAQKKGQSKISLSDNKEKEKDDKLSSKIPRKERASRSRTEKNEENEQFEKSVETRRTSGRRRSSVAKNANMNEDDENVLSANGRPSRQRKMTWKIRESLNDSQGNILPDEKSKRGSRGSSGSNSQNESTENFETSGRSSRSRNNSPTKKLGTEVSIVGTSKSMFLRKSPGQDKIDLSERKNQNAQATTRIGQKRKIEESSSETPSKKSRKEEHGQLENKVKDTNDDRNTRASRRREQSQSGIKLKDKNSEQSIRSSTRISKQSPVISNTAAATENGKIESSDLSTRRNTRKKMEISVTPCLKELNTSVSGVSSRQQRGQKRKNVNIDEKIEHTPAKQQKQENTNSLPAKTGVLTDELESVRSSRSSRSRGKGTPQKTDAESTKLVVQKAKSDRASRTRNDNSEENTESLTLQKVPTTPQHSRSLRGKAIPQSSTQKNASNTEARRSTPRKSKNAYQVLFTGFSNVKQESIVKQLGGSVVDLPEAGTVLVTDKIRRTYKFLCVMGRGKPIVSPEWLTQCQRLGHFVDPWQYLIKDDESESKFRFQLRESLQLAAKSDLLAGYSIHVTPKVKPPPLEMKGIIESCGGTYLQQAPSKTWPANSFIVSCPEDKSTWMKLKKAGKPIVASEVLLLGVLQQKLDLKSNSLV